MASQIDPTTIDTTYPIAGQDNDTRGFHNNYRAIQNGLLFAKTEITDLQSNVSDLQSFVGFTSLTSLEANLGTATTNITTLFSNAAGQANQITGANAAIVTANSAVVSYVNTLNSEMAANVAGTNAAIITSNNAVVSYIDNRFSTLIGGATSALDTLNEIAISLGNNSSLSSTLINSITGVQANVTAANIKIQTLDANVGALVIGSGFATTSQLAANVNAANAAIITANTSLRNYTVDQISIVNNSIFVNNNAINANLGSVTSSVATLTSNAATQQTQINTLNTRSLSSSALGSVSGNVTINLNNGSYQTLTTSGNINLSFSNWPLSGNVGKVSLDITVSNAAHKITVPPAVSLGGYGIIGANSASNTQSFPAAGSYQFDFISRDAGATIRISEDNALLRPYNASSEFITSTSSTINLGTTYSVYAPTPASTAGTGTLGNGVAGQIKVLGSISTTSWTVTVLSPTWGGVGQITFYGAGCNITLIWSDQLSSWIVLNSHGSVSLS
jgi:hypothetical protein